LPRNLITVTKATRLFNFEKEDLEPQPPKANDEGLINRKRRLLAMKAKVLFNFERHLHFCKWRQALKYRAWFTCFSFLQRKKQAFAGNLRMFGGKTGVPEAKTGFIVDL
jgi:hypothetical protein